jgi:23S rRNA pseudouridine955/2504/2580 synthase
MTEKVMDATGAAPASVKTLIISADNDGQRIDNFLLTHLRGVPRTHVYRLLRTGQVRVNSRRAKPGYRLREGDNIRVPPVTSRAEQAPVPPTDKQRGIILGGVLYEDEQLLALNKPAGLPVHGGSGLPTGLVNLLKAVRHDLPFAELAHRLDRYTSGCLLFAKDRATLLGLHRQFRDGQVDKHYLALVKGRWHGGARVVDSALAGTRLASGERRMTVGEEGKAASTRFVPREVYPNATLVEARPLTGRTHQIRVHAVHVGHPIAGDTKYGDRAFNREMRQLGLRRLFLHACELELTHPATGRRLHIQAPLPLPLQKVLERFDKHDAPF